MDEATRKEADRRFEEAMASTGARDPREFYRGALRELKEQNPEGYAKAVEHFQTVLVPTVAEGKVEPLLAWREYGKLLAEMIGPGRTVAIDETGKEFPYSADAPMERLVLHLPNAKGARPVLVALPAKPSQAQMATYQLLVQGKHRLP